MSNPTIVRPGARAVVPTIAALGLLVTVGGCSEDRPDLTEPEELAPAFASILSDPVQSSDAALAALTGAARPSAAKGGGVVYVSIPPASIPDGVRIAIRNLETGAERTERLVDGGLDPLPVPAVAGERLELVATLTGGVTLTSTVKVPARRPPRVVRTMPPRGKRDVPLNARITIVFSEPLDARTVTPASIRLQSGDVRVSGEVVLGADGLRAEFQPDGLLASNTTYTLVVTSDVTDVSGDRLEQTMEVPFTTGSVTGAIDALAVMPSSLTLASGETLQLVTWAADAAGNEFTALDVSWSSADPTVATVSAAGAVTGVKLGTTTVTATADGARATATIDVVELVFGSVSAGAFHTCGLTTSGVAYCWGGNAPGNEHGVLGNGSTVNSPTPSAVIGGLTFVQISAGTAHTCALTADGEAYCWGDNSLGGRLGAVWPEECQVGWGFRSVPCSTRPVAVTGGLRFTSISAGAAHTCGVTSDGAAYCWGRNRTGELGNGTTVSSVAPVAVAGGLTFASVSAGGGLTCGVTRQGQAYCWGNNTLTQLGIGLFSGPESCPESPRDWQDCSTVPTAVVSNGLAFATVRAGVYHACGLTVSGTAHCWGFVFQWEPEAAIPIALPPEHTYEAIDVFAGKAPALSRICLIASGGAVYCRNGDESDLRSLPVPGGLAFASVSLRGDHACGLTRQGRAYCWGSNESGQLGNGSLGARRDVPVKVAGQR